jgi:hypothetical protein
MSTARNRCLMIILQSLSDALSLPPGLGYSRGCSGRNLK